MWSVIIKDPSFLRPDPINEEDRCTSDSVSHVFDDCCVVDSHFVIMTDIRPRSFDRFVRARTFACALWLGWDWGHKIRIPQRRRPLLSFTPR